MLKQIAPKGKVCITEGYYKNYNRKQRYAVTYTWLKGNCNKILCKYLAGKDMYKKAIKKQYVGC